MNVTFNVSEGPKDQDSRHRVRRQQRHRRRQAAAQAEGEQAEGDPVVHHRRRHLQGNRVRGRRRSDRRVLPEPGLRARPRRPARAEGAREHQGRQDALDPAADSGHRRPPLPRRRAVVCRQHAGEERAAAAALQDAAGRVVQPEGSGQRPQEGAGDLRRRRLHGVHRVPGSEAERRPRARGSAGGAGARGAARAARSRPGQGRGADGRHHDADRGRASSTSSTASCSPATPRRATT